METTIKKWGNSQGVMISKKLLSQIGIHQPVNQSIDIDVDGDRLIIKKISNESKIDKLFEGFDTEKYFKEHPGSHEVNWGSSVGKEAW